VYAGQQIIAESKCSSRSNDSPCLTRSVRTNTADGSLIIHRGELDPHPDNCETFIHPPYASSQEYRGENDGHYQARVSLAEMAIGASKCGFCFILYNGVRYQREFWIEEWAKLQWMDSHSDYDPVEAAEGRPWIDEFRDEIGSGTKIDEDRVALDITFPKDQKRMTVTLVLLGQQEDSSGEDTSAESASEEGVSEEDAFEKDSSEDSLILPRTDEERRKAPGFREPSRTMAELEYYTRPGSPNPWAAFMPAPHIQPDIFSNHCLRKIHGWIEECTSDHPACVENAWTMRSEDDSGLPRRLLKLRDCHEDPPLVRLEEITDSQKMYRYVALSHVWAYTEPYQTTLENYSDHTARVPWENLSRALQEVVALVLTLEYEYLWVDSLCIIQDDLADKEKELPRMSLIYGQAALVFAAYGPDLGFKKIALLVIEDPYHTDDAPVYCRLKIHHSNMFSASKDPSSWLGRAWCMQERIFAPRILHFGGSMEELFFECNTLVQCECGALSKDRNQRQATLKKKITDALARVGEDVEPTEFCNELWKVYITACENYTSRGISFPTDTLGAVSSLMHRFIPHLGKYHAGLWEYNLLISLQWEASMTEVCRRHKDYVAPSFSWASRSGGVVWYLPSSTLPMPETHDFATIVDISCDLAGSDPCGRVSGGYMTLRGYTTEMKIESKLLWQPDGRLEMAKEGFKSCFVTLDSREDLDRVRVGTIVKCLDIMRDKEGYQGNFVSGLILLPTDSDDGRYCRIGFSTMWADHFKDSLLETLIIV
jgi:hypothetical protein